MFTWATAHLSHLIVNAAASCYSCRQALGLNAVSPTCFCTMFWLRKSKCSEIFENEGFTMTVARVVNHGEMLDDCSCASKWWWVLVNGSCIGLLSQRCEKPEGSSKLHLCVQFFFFFSFFKLLCNPSDILLNTTKEAALRRKNTG